MPATYFDTAKDFKVATDRHTGLSALLVSRRREQGGRRKVSAELPVHLVPTPRNTLRQSVLFYKLNHRHGIVGSSSVHINGFSSAEFQKTHSCQDRLALRRFRSLRSRRSAGRIQRRQRCGALRNCAQRHSFQHRRSHGRGAGRSAHRQPRRGEREQRLFAACGTRGLPLALRQIAAGDNHSLALKSDGTVVDWGNNYYGQDASPRGLVSVLAITAGSTQSLALSDSEPPGSPPVIINSPFAVAGVGSTFRYRIKAKGRPSSYGAAGLPPGCDINVATGLITGVATAAGTFAMIISATNDFGTSQKTVHLTINAPSP